ncbi:MAG: hypothetical protein AAB067_05760, partial [Planctomycetota bacterium]
MPGSLTAAMVARPDFSIHGKTELREGLVGPDAQPAVLGEAVAAYPRAGEEEKKLILLQTRQKSRMEATYSRPGMT